MWRAIYLLCALTAALAPARAEDVRRLRVHLRAETSSDDRLFERLRGQTSDLPVALATYRPAAPLGSFGGAVTEAMAHCRDADVDVVVWALSAPSEDGASLATGWIVALATCKDARLLARRLDMGRGPTREVEARGSAREQNQDSVGPTSGALEAAALVLRGALSVLTQGGSVGVVAAQAAAENPSLLAVDANADVEVDAKAALPSVAASRADSQLAAAGETARASGAQAAAQTRTERSDSVREPAAPSEASALLWLAQLGYQHSWDGADAAGRPALSAGMSLGRARFQLGVAGSFGFRTTQRDAYTELSLSRHSLAGSLRWNVWQRAAWQCSLGADLGSVFYQRSTESLSASAEARAPALSVVGFVSPWLSLGRRLGPIFLALSAALDVLPAVPRFVYQREEMRQSAVALWHVAPRLGFALLLGAP